MKKNAIILTLSLVLSFTALFAGCEKETQPLCFVEGEELIYLYEGASLSRLSEAVGKKLTSPGLSANDIIPTGSELYADGELFKTAVFAGDVNGDGSFDDDDILMAENLRTQQESDASHAAYAAADINASGLVDYEDVDILNNFAQGLCELPDFMDKRTSGFVSDEIMVVIRYDDVNSDYSVYTPEYFGDGFSDCKIYDLFSGHGLYLILTVKNSSVDQLEKQIRALSGQSDVLQAKKNTGDDTVTLTEYVPEKHVHLLNRRYPFSTEYDGFSYDRNYRLIYYTTTNFDDLVPQEQYDEWFAYYRELNGYHSGYSYEEKEPCEMALVSFIKYCNIPREAVEKRIAEIEAFREEQGIDFVDESNEIPDADILYTFNNAIINDYYRYE